MLRNRWTVLSVLVLLLMALPQSVCLGDVGILNGDFSLLNVSSQPLYWIRDPDSNAGVVRTSECYPDSPPSNALAWAGSQSFTYWQCVDTSTWSGQVEVGGLVQMFSDYDPQNGYIEVTWYDEPDCEGTGYELTLNPQLVGPGYWTRLSGVQTLSSPRAGMVSMRVLLYGKANEWVCFDNVYAQGQPTTVAMRDVSARPASAVTAMLGVTAVGLAAHWIWRKSAKSRLRA